MSLHVKYRPSTFDEVVGQRDVVENLKQRLSEPDGPQAFLFTGPSGTGKTSIGRIIGQALRIKCIEIDSANYRGVDAAREFAKMCGRRGGFFPVKTVFIFDECHQMTSDAMHVMLKVVEEPAPNVFIVFCTTEPDKLIEPLRNRCLHYRLKPVSNLEIRGLLERVIKAESLGMKGDIIDLVVIASKGIPRQALINLEKVRGIDDPGKAEELIYEE